MTVWGWYPQGSQRRGFEERFFRWESKILLKPEQNQGPHTAGRKKADPAEPATAEPARRKTATAMPSQDQAKLSKNKEKKTTAQQPTPC